MSELSRRARDKAASKKAKYVPVLSVEDREKLKRFIKN